LSVLDVKGVGAIWQLHVDAAEAHRTGYPAAAYERSSAREDPS
jgi:hypothetical protein